MRLVSEHEGIENAFTEEVPALPAADDAEEQLRADEAASYNQVPCCSPAASRPPELTPPPGFDQNEVAIGSMATHPNIDDTAVKQPLYVVEMPPESAEDITAVCAEADHNGNEPAMPDGEPGQTGAEDLPESDSESPASDAGGDGGQEPPDDSPPSSGNEDDPDRPRGWLAEEPRYVRDLNEQPRRATETLGERQQAVVAKFAESPVTHAWHKGTLHSSKPGVARMTAEYAVDDQGHKAMDVKTLKVNKDVRLAGLGATFLKEVIDDFASQDIAVVKAETRSVAAARSAFRAVGAENVTFATTDPNGEEVTLPMTPQQALGSINRAAEHGDKSGLGLRVDLYAQEDKKVGEQAERRRALSDAEIATEQRIEFEVYKAPVGRFVELVESGANPSDDPHYVGTEGERIVADTFRIYPEPSGKPRPVDAIGTHPGYTARIFRPIEGVTEEEFMETREHEELRAKALERALHMKPELQRNVERMVAREHLSEVDLELGLVPAMISAVPAGDVLNDAILVSTENISRALVELRATVVNMAKHGIAPARSPAKHIRWDGRRFGLTAPVPIGDTVTGDDLRDLAKSQFALMADQVLYLAGSQGDAIFREATMAWSELNIGFDDYWYLASD